MFSRWLATANHWFTSVCLCISVEMVYLTVNNVSCEYSIHKSRGRVSFKYILWPFQDEKMNERHVTTTSHTAKNKGGSKQECVNLEAFIFDFTYYQSLKSMEIVFFLWMETWALELSSFVMWWRNDECGWRDATWARVITTTTIMTTRPLQSTGNDLTD
jgi:hypothetical protein